MAETKTQKAANTKREPEPSDFSELPRVHVDQSSADEVVLGALQRVEAWINDVAREALSGTPFVFEDEDAGALRARLDEERARVRHVVRLMLDAIDDVRAAPHRDVDLRNEVIAAVLSFAAATRADILEADLVAFAINDDRPSLAKLLASHPRPYAVGVVYEAAVLAAREIAPEHARQLEEQRDDAMRAIEALRANKPAKAVGALSRILGRSKSSDTEAHRAFKEWREARAQRG